MEKANYYVEDIVWDIDLEGETYEEAREELELPTLVRLPEKLSEELDAEQADDEDVADYLSDTFGFCVCRFKMKKKELNSSFKAFSYAMYKAYWLFEHKEVNIMQAYAEYSQCLLAGIIDPATSFEKYLEEFGFSGGIGYACYEEFLDNEFKEREIMEKIYCKDPAFIKLWEEEND